MRNIDNTPSKDGLYSAPHWRDLVREVRALPELGRYLLNRKSPSDLPQGDLQPVMLVPGYGASERYMAPLMSRLNGAGFAAYGWGLGYNFGMSKPVKQAMGERVLMLQQKHHQKVALVGWSLGGVFVRELARHQPESISHVFSVGSPISHDPNGNNMAKLFNLMNPGKEVDADMEAFRKREQAPPVPCTAIYSKSDGIVNWRCAEELRADNTENLLVKSSHFGLPFNPDVARIIAERLVRYKTL